MWLVRMEKFSGREVAWVRAVDFWVMASVGHGLKCRRKSEKRGSSAGLSVWFLAFAVTGIFESLSRIG